MFFNRPQSTERDTVCKNHSLETTPIKSPSTEDVSGQERMPRSQLKTSNRLRQRVFKSLERKADKVFNLLTPKKIKNEGPTRLKCIKVEVYIIFLLVFNNLLYRQWSMFLAHLLRILIKSKMN